MKAVLYGDLLQKMFHKNRAYEKNIGETEKKFEKWMKKCKEIVRYGTTKEFKKSVYEMVEDFEKIKWDKNIRKPKVGIVGEILIKYHPFGNNYIADFLHREGAEVVLPDFMGFIKYVLANKVVSSNLLKLEGAGVLASKAALYCIDRMERDSKKALSKSKKGYLLPTDIWHLEKQVKKVLSSGNQTGEGWFLTAEMIEYIENDIPNIVCVQPFACLPNHIVGKGVIKTIRNLYLNANIAPIDYDPGASNSNQINRIKLLMTVAHENLAISDKKIVRILMENEDVEDDKKKIKETIEKR